MLATIKERMPPREQNLLVFAVCAFPIFAWSIISALRQIPSWSLQFDLWELLSMFAYTQVFALLESAIIFGLLWLAAVLLPGRILRERLVAKSALVMLAATVWFIYLHLNDNFIRAREFLPLALWAGSLLLALTVGFILVHRSARVRQSIHAIVERLAVLSAIYVAIGVISVVIVAIRNV